MAHRRKRIDTLVVRRADNTATGDMIPQISVTQGPSGMRQREVFCSICTPAYLRKTLACLRSLHTQHPGSVVTLLLLPDGKAAFPPIQDNSWLSFCTPEDTVSPALFLEMRARYSIAELCFALKPYLLRRLLEQGSGQVHYLDGDCLVLQPLKPMMEQLAKADLLLTPHLLSPVPDDGRKPTALTLLRGGVFNGGYLGVRNTETGRAFVDWLAAMTRTQAFNLPKLGMCGDQRWLDLAPALFSGSAICRHRGANAAYWNLHERPLSCETDGSFSVGGEPLLFFHFSGFDADRPAQLSRYQNRHEVVDGLPLAKLVGIYRARLTAEGSEREVATVKSGGLFDRWRHASG